jgi:APA family basic amino acid/polyamine antiporter
MDATMINTGAIIGSGIFMVPATVAALTGSSSLFIGVWIVGGLISLFGALSIAELAAAMPRAGGQYIYLKEAYGPVWGYLYGWSAVAVINTASIAAVGVAFSEYLGYFFVLSANAIKITAVGTIVVLSILNIVDVKSGARFQNIFTFAKLGAIFGVIAIGLFMKGGNTGNLTPVLSGQPLGSLIGPLGLAMVSVLWTFDGWISITYVAGEVKKPERNIPLSLILCMIIVVSVYLLLNYVLLYTLGFAGMRGSELVVSDAVSIFLGEKGAALVTLAILISLIGANNGFILTSARINYAMAKDTLFFNQAARIHPTFQSPANALIIQCIWACLLTFTGTFNQLITYIIFTSWIFYAMSSGAVIILRRNKPELTRPYKTPGYPYVPIVFILFAILLTLNTIVEAPRDAAIGGGLVLAGLPFYYYWKNND